MKQLYALAFYAVDEDGIGSLRAGSVLANSGAEAIGMGYDYIMREFPARDGYNSHTVSYHKIPEDAIESAYLSPVL